MNQQNSAVQRAPRLARASQALVQGDFDLLQEKAAALCHCRYRQTKKKVKSFVAKAVYSLPVVARHNPRRKVVQCKDHCRVVETFPAPSGAPAPDWYLTIRPPETLHRKMSIGIDEGQLEQFRAGVQRFNDGEVFQIPEVFLAGLHQARIYSPDFLVLTPNNEILFESALSWDAVLENNGIYDTLVRPPLQSVAGDFCLLGCPWAVNNYSEWLLGILPRLATLGQFDPLTKLPLIVPRNLKRYQQDTLQLAGVPPERLAGFDGGYWQVDRLYVPQLMSPLGNPSPHAVAWLRKTFLGNNAPAAASPGRRLYLTRRDAPKRKIINETELIECLGSRGFEIICPGELTFAQQIEIFREASVVVGPHGAGFTNMVFAPARATVVELFGDNYIHGCFWALANLMGHKHAFLTGPSRAMDYSIDPGQLLSLLERVDGLPA